LPSKCGARVAPQLRKTLGAADAIDCIAGWRFAPCGPPAPRCEQQAEHTAALDAHHGRVLRVSCSRSPTAGPRATSPVTCAPVLRVLPYARGASRGRTTHVGETDWRKRSLHAKRCPGIALNAPPRSAELDLVACPKRKAYRLATAAVLPPRRQAHVCASMPGGPEPAPRERPVPATQHARRSVPGDGCAHVSLLGSSCASLVRSFVRLCACVCVCVCVCVCDEHSRPTCSRRRPRCGACERRQARPQSYARARECCGCC
jgi:hypothetical protein